MIRSFLKGGVFYKTPQLHENASISKDSDIVNKWYVDTKVNNTQINIKQYVDSSQVSTRQYVDSRVASIPIINESSFVKINGNQIINDTKSFNSSPTVPSPSASNHAANKAYVDSKTSSGGFSQSFGNNGWTKLPNGLIIQWGIAAMLKNEKDYVVRFPIQFPNNTLNVSMTRGTFTGTGGNATSIQAYDLQPGSVTITNPGRETWVYYIAIGY